MKSLNPISLVWDWHRQRLVRRRLEKFVSLDTLKNMRVLDVGCGRNKLYEFGLGVDSKNYPGVNVVLDFWEFLDAFPPRYDIVLLLQVLEHVDEPEKLLEQLANKTDGFLVVEVPNVDSWLWRVVWRVWRGLGMARESVHRDLHVNEVLDCVRKRFEVVDVGFSWFGMIMSVIAKKDRVASIKASSTQEISEGKSTFE